MGGVVGGIVVIVLILAGMYFVYRRGRRRGLEEAGFNRGYSEAKLKEQSIVSGNADQNRNLEARNSMDSPNLKAEANTEVEPASQDLRHLDAERIGTALG